MGTHRQVTGPAVVRILVGLAAVGMVCALWRARGAAPADAPTVAVAGAGADPATQAAFSSIYANEVWGQGGNGSGAGSTLEYTARTRAAIEMLVYKLDLGGLIDAPCGGMTWMPLVLHRVWQARPKFKYHGLDIVESVIATNLKRFKAVPNMRFAALDFSQTPLPKLAGAGPAPRLAVFSRDALQHLPMDVVVDALQNFVASSATYVIVGSYGGGPGSNVDIPAGHYFPIDLMAEPFSLPPPLDVVEEETADKKLMLVFEVAELRKKVDFKAMRARVAKAKAAPAAGGR